jgi:glycosyltransferase involved in cell wall biosynthesis
MISNCNVDDVAVIEITNELPFNRLGGVGSVIDSLISGFQTLDVPVLWYLIDHHYAQVELDRILAEFPNVAVGTLDDLRTIRAPIAHLHTYNHNPRILDYLNGQKTVFTIHSLLRCEAESNNIDLGWAIERQERLIAGCNEIVLVSQAELGHYARLGYLGLNDRVHVIHNGLKCPGSCQRSTASRKLGFCGRLVPRKRPEYVQLILKEKGFEGYSSLIAGRGFSAYARDLMRDSELRPRVRYLGWCGRERLEAFYREIELLVIPSAYEPFGMVALEAMSRGVPIVCTRIDGLVESLGDEAIYTEDDGYEAFRRAMWEWLRTEQPRLDAMAQGARTRFLERFTDVIAAEKYRSFFERVA